jgi:hypothetical protein
MPTKTYTVRLRGANFQFMNEASEKGLSGAETLRACVQLAREANLLDEMDPPTSPARRPNQVDPDEATGGDVADTEVDRQEEQGGGVTAADLAREEAERGAAQDDDPPEPEDSDDDVGGSGGDWFDEW